MIIEAHSRLDSPSAADRTEACAGSVALTMHLPDTSSAAADAGTLMHWLASTVLANKHQWVLKGKNGQEAYMLDLNAYLLLFPDGRHECPDVSPDLRVTQEMCDIAQVYVDYVRRVAGDNELLVEQRVAFNEALGVPEGAEGTADAIVLDYVAGRVTVVDLKSGYQIVWASGSQLKRYALGVRETFGHLGPFKTWRLVIVQPARDHIDELEITDAELDEYQALARQSAADVRQALAEQADPAIPEAEWEARWLRPTTKGCQWCKAREWCAARTAKVAEVVGIEDMEDLTTKPAAPAVPMAQQAFRAMDWVDFVEDWCKSVRARVEGLLLSGVTDEAERWKLVEGRRGARAWTDEDAAEKLMREKFRLKIDQAYTLKLISPTQAEKVLGKQQKRWAQLEKLIDRSPGKPSVAPAADKRPAISVAPTTEGMDDISASLDDLL